MTMKKKHTKNVSVLRLALERAARSGTSKIVRAALRTRAGVSSVPSWAVQRQGKNEEKNRCSTE